MVIRDELIEDVKMGVENEPFPLTDSAGLRRGLERQRPRPAQLSSSFSCLIPCLLSYLSGLVRVITFFGPLFKEHCYWTRVWKAYGLISLFCRPFSLFPAASPHFEIHVESTPSSALYHSLHDCDSFPELRLCCTTTKIRIIEFAPSLRPNSTCTRA